MATAKTRINISVPDDVRNALEQLAQREKVPVATKAQRLIEVGLELEEDQTWDQIAAERDTKEATFLTHDEVFGA